MMKHLPNFLTLARILAIPFLVIFYYIPWQHAHAAAGIIFIVASATDWFDGYLARRLQVTSRLGALLDPIADKLLVATALIVLTANPVSSITIPAIIIICRELSISGIRAWMAEVGQVDAMAVNQLGKWKTATQMLAIIFLFWHPQADWTFIGALTYALVYISAGLALWSLVVYLRAGWNAIQVEDL